MKQLTFPDCNCSFDIQNNGSIDITSILENPDLECSATWKMLQEDPSCVFQLESSFGQHYTKRIHPENINQLSDVGALLRPSCTQGMIEDKTIIEHYIERKHGKESQPIDESLSEILNKTQNLCLYQEQAMAIVSELAGFSLEDSDTLRKAMGKKLPGLMAKVGKDFLKGCKKIGKVNEEKAKEIWEMLLASQRYSFNKCLSSDTSIYVRYYKNKHLWLEEKKISLGALYRILKKRGDLSDNEKRLKRAFRNKELCSLSLDENRTRVCPNRLINITHEGLMPVWKIVTKEGKSVKCSINHKFPIQRNGEEKTLQLSKMNIGDKLYVGAKLSLEQVVSIEYVGNEECYNVEMDTPNHNFILNNGIITCNSHSVSYSYNGYISAYLKTHFPKEFFTAYLRYARDKIKPYEEIKNLILNAQSYNIVVNRPDLRQLNEYFVLVEGKIRYGLTDVRGIGESSFKKLERLLEGKEIGKLTWAEFLNQYAGPVGKTTTESLVDSGALSFMGVPRRRMIFERDIYEHMSDSEKHWLATDCSDCPLEFALERILLHGIDRKNGPCKTKQSYEKTQAALNSLKDPPHTLEDSPDYIVEKETRLLGIPITCTKLDGKNTEAANCTVSEFNSGINMKTFFLPIKIDRVKEILTKKGDPMAFVDGSDNTGETDKIVCFPKPWKEHGDKIVEGNVILIQGNKTDKGSLSINSVIQL